MFPHSRNINTAFRQTRLLAILVILGSLGLAGWIALSSLQVADRAQQRIWLRSDGKVLEAMAGDRRENIPVEARDHIRRFHEYFFTLDPDEKVIRANIGKALYLADGSAKRLYDNLEESGYYANIISGNVSQEITIDSILVNTDHQPFYFRCWCTQRIIRTTSIVTRSLVTEGWLRSISRSDNNPHGFLIERWTTLENKDLKIETR